MLPTPLPPEAIALPMPITRNAAMIIMIHVLLRILRFGGCMVSPSNTKFAQLYTICANAVVAKRLRFGSAV